MCLGFGLRSGGLFWTSNLKGLWFAIMAWRFEIEGYIGVIQGIMENGNYYIIKGDISGLW